MEFKKCFVPSCDNDSVNSPDKIFVKLRGDLRKPWCKAANAEFFRIYTYYCCEDHFDPEKDVQNFYTYKENKSNPVLKPTAKFRYVSKEEKQKLSQDRPLLSVRKIKKRPSSATVICAAKKRATKPRMTDYSKACRCCLLRVGTMKPLFGSSLDVMLRDLMGFPIARNDGYPQQICTRCIRNLSSAHSFYQTVKKSHKTVEEKCNVAKRSNVEKPSVVFPIKVENREIKVETKVKQVAVSCQTDEKFFQKLMLANVQLSRVERESSHEMEDAEYVVFSDNEEEIPETKNVVQVTTDDTRGYKCPQCMHVANNQAQLKGHMKTHMSDATKDEGEIETPAHLCNVCGQTFKCRTSLYKHLRFHSGHIFECKYCDKQFAESSTLKVHLISHSLSNAKPFDCPACNRSFTQQAALNKHSRTMHAAQRAMFHCQLCGRSFLYKYSLQKHCLKHHTAIRCNICDAEFPGMLALERHIKNHKENQQDTIEAEYLEFDDL